MSGIPKSVLLQDVRKRPREKQERACAIVPAQLCGAEVVVKRQQIEAGTAIISAFLCVVCGGTVRAGQSSGVHRHRSPNACRLHPPNHVRIRSQSKASSNKHRAQCAVCAAFSFQPCSVRDPTDLLLFFRLCFEVDENVEVQLAALPYCPTMPTLCTRRSRWACVGEGKNA